MSAPAESLHHDLGLLSRTLLQSVPLAGLSALPVPGLRCLRRNAPASEAGLLSPCVFMVVQGEVRMTVNGEEFCLRPGQCLANCVDMHTVFSLDASDDIPFLALSLAMDGSIFTEMFRELDETKGSAPGENRISGETGSSGISSTSRGMYVSQVTPALLNAFQRLTALEGDERRIRFVSQLILREICFYLAEDENGAFLRAFYASSTQGSQIARAIAYMREHCHERLRIETLARLADMAESTFNRNFRRITSLSPLQYHKNLKLHEARRLMIAESMSAAAACYAVGYESQQQFTREYKRLFGCPPMKDARRSQ